MQVKQIINSVFTSNTYIISDAKSNWVWLIDVGDIEGVLNALSENSYVKGVFITHAHHDHIYGINNLIDTFPGCIVYTSEYGKDGLYSEKLNLSFYREDPVVFKGSKVQILHESDQIELFDNCSLETVETSGHNWGSLSFRINNFLFTGDSFIPGFDVVTKLKGGDKEAAKESLQKINSLISKNTIICPGHGSIHTSDELHKCNQRIGFN